MEDSKKEKGISPLAKAFMSDAKTFFNIEGSYYEHAENVVTNNFSHVDSVYTGKSNTEYLSPVKTFKAALAMLCEDEMISGVQDFCCLYRLDTEMTTVGFCSIPDFVKRLPSMMPAASEQYKLPNENNFKKLDFGKKVYPYWNWETFGENNRPHIKALCNAYIKFMASKGFVHPMLNSTNTTKE